MVGVGLVVDGRCWIGCGWLVLDWLWMVGVAFVQQWPHGGRCINKVIDQEYSSEYGLASTCIGNKFHKDYILRRIVAKRIAISLSWKIKKMPLLNPLSRIPESDKDYDTEGQKLHKSQKEFSRNGSR